MTAAPSEILQGAWAAEQEKRKLAAGRRSGRRAERDREGREARRSRASIHEHARDGVLRRRRGSASGSLRSGGSLRSLRTLRSCRSLSALLSGLALHGPQRELEWLLPVGTFASQENVQIALRLLAVLPLHTHGDEVRPLLRRSDSARRFVRRLREPAGDQDAQTDENRRCSPRERAALPYERTARVRTHADRTRPCPTPQIVRERDLSRPTRNLQGCPRAHWQCRDPRGIPASSS